MEEKNWKTWRSNQKMDEEFDSEDRDGWRIGSERRDGSKIREELCDGCQNWSEGCDGSVRVQFWWMEHSTTRQSEIVWRFY